MGTITRALVVIFPGTLMYIYQNMITGEMETILVLNTT